MSSIRKRLEDVEMFKAYRDFVQATGQFKGRTRDELRFFLIRGYPGRAGYAQS